MVVLDALSHILENRRLARLRGRNDQTTLPLADGGHEFEQTEGHAAVGRLQLQVLIGEDRGERIELRTVEDVPFSTDAIDASDTHQ